MDIYAKANKYTKYAMAYIDIIYGKAYVLRMEQVARNPKQVGEAVRRVRRQQKLTQGQLGSKMDVRQATVSSLEGGDAGTKLRTLMDALAALNLELVIRPRGSGDADFESMF